MGSDRERQKEYRSAGKQLTGWAQVSQITTTMISVFSTSLFTLLRTMLSPTLMSRNTTR